MVSELRVQNQNSRAHSPQSSPKRAMYSPKKAMATHSISPERHVQAKVDTGLQKSASPARPVVTPIQKFLNHTATEKAQL